MGVNMAGNCIVDDEICKEASRQEIIRRYYKSCDALVSGTGKEDEVCKIELLLKQAHASIEDRKVVPAALSMEKKTTAPAAALELPDGKIIYGKTSDLPVSYTHLDVYKRQTTQRSLITAAMF